MISTASGYRPPSTGSGLSICRSIVEAHCGTLHVRVNEPRGAVFRVELPLAEAG
ncbi:ATP-binding protein [Burkholderia cepacia]|uniref:ATP-binding protein n=1 Tax=Burkholderia cepacia TaxID=292 RepID=UPI002FEDEA41